MVRKGYPFSKRSSKQMTNLVSGLLAGLFVAPIAAVDALSKSNSNVASSKKNKKKDALLELFLGVFFITPIYVLLVYVAFSSEFIFVTSTKIFVVLWWAIISDIIEAFKKKEETATEAENSSMK